MERPSALVNSIRLCAQQQSLRDLFAAYSTHSDRLPTTSHRTLQHSPVLLPWYLHRFVQNTLLMIVCFAVIWKNFGFENLTKTEEIHLIFTYTLNQNQLLFSHAGCIYLLDAGPIDFCHFRNTPIFHVLRYIIDETTMRCGFLFEIGWEHFNHFISFRILHSFIYLLLSYCRQT